MNLHLLTADAYFFHRSRNLWDGIYYIRLYMFLDSNEPHVWDDVLRFRDALLIQTWRCAALTRRVQKLPVGDKEQNISCFHNEKSVNAIRSLSVYLKQVSFHLCTRMWCSSGADQMRHLHNQKALFKNPQCFSFFTHVVACVWRIFQHQGIPLISAVINQPRSWRRRNCWWEFLSLFPQCPQSIMAVSTYRRCLASSLPFQKRFSSKNRWRHLFSSAAASGFNHKQARDGLVKTWLLSLCLVKPVMSIMRGRKSPF